jgi:hypothetical protein
MCYYTYINNSAKNTILTLMDNESTILRNEGIHRILFESIDCI